MNETSKMNRVRKERGYDEFFIGNGIDIGCGPDILSSDIFPGIESVLAYDTPQGNANTCSNLADNSFGFVYSSHCLEHMDDPKISLSNWLRICKPGGHVIVAVPHEVYYEKLQWPSRYNHDHKWSFRMEMISPLPNSIWVQQFLSEFAEAEILLCELFLIDFDFSQFWIDQTRQDAVCQIEFVLKKVA